MSAQNNSCVLLVFNRYFHIFICSEYINVQNKFRINLPVLLKIIYSYV